MDTSRLSSFTPTKRSSDFDSIRKLTSLSTNSSHSLSGMPELGGFGIRVPLSSMAVSATPAVLQPLTGRMSAKHRSRSGDIRAPIATSEELSPMTPMSQNHSQSGDLMQLIPDAKFMANQSLGPTMSSLLSGPLRKDNSFSDDKKEIAGGTTDGIGDISFGAASSGRSRHPRTASNQARDMNLSQTLPSGRSTPTSIISNQLGSITSVPATVKRPASFARAVNSDNVVTSTDQSRRDRLNASQPPGLETQHEESTSNILEISV